MDLGEMVCLPKGDPLCSTCPFKDVCKAHQNGTTASFPAPKKTKEKREESWTVLLYVVGDKVAIEQRPATWSARFALPVPDCSKESESKDDVKNEQIRHPILHGFRKNHPHVLPPHLASSRLPNQPAEAI
jgi:A/G-specific adenine glycosylase